MNEKEMIEQANKHIEELRQDLEIGKKNEVIENPFTGEKIECDPLSAALYDYLRGIEFSQASETIALICNKGESNWFLYSSQMVRKWFSIHRPKIYMTLID